MPRRHDFRHLSTQTMTPRRLNIIGIVSDQTMIRPCVLQKCHENLPWGFNISLLLLLLSIECCMFVMDWSDMVGDQKGARSSSHPTSTERLHPFSNSQSNERFLFPEPTGTCYANGRSKTLLEPKTFQSNKELNCCLIELLELRLLLIDKKSSSKSLASFRIKTAFRLSAWSARSRSKSHLTCAVAIKSHNSVRLDMYQLLSAATIMLLSIPLYNMLFWFICHSLPVNAHSARADLARHVGLI